MNGERRPIPDNRIPEKYKHITNAKSFHARPNFDPDAATACRDQLFEQLRTKWNYTLGFASPIADPRGPHFDDTAGNKYGCTMLNMEQMVYDKHLNPRWGIWSFITYTDIDGLFRDDLNDADRMCIEWSLATTVR